MKNNKPFLISAFVFACLFSNFCMAASIDIGQGSTVNFGNSIVNNPSHSLTNSGTSIFADSTTSLLSFSNSNNAQASANGATISIVEDWNNNGTFNAGNSTVNFIDGGSNSSKITGETRFNVLTVASAIGKILEFQAERQQIVLQHLQLTGVDGNLLTIISDTPGTPGMLALSLNNNASQLIDYVDVTDNFGTSQIIAPGTPESYNSIQGSNVRGWFGTPLAFPIPSLSLIGLLILSTVLILLASKNKNKGIQL